MVTPKTCEDIEAEVNGSILLRMQMGSTINKLKKAERSIGTEPLKILILGYRKLSLEEFTEASKKFGVVGINAIHIMEKLSKGQKQYIFKRMDWPVEEVDMTAEEMERKYHS